MFKHLATGTLAVLVMTGVTSSPMSAQVMPSERWSLTVGAGTAPSISGIYHEGGTGTVLGFPTEVAERNWSDIYGTGFTMRVGAGFALTRHTEAVGSFGYARREAEELSVGTVAGLDLRSVFSQNREWGLEGGLRWHFAPEATVAPFVGIAAGARRIDVMPATFSVPAAGVVLPDTPFYARSTVPTMGGDFGARFAVAPRLRLGVEAGLRWTGDLEVLDGLAGTGLENLNDSSSRWTMPVLGTMTVSF